MERFVYLKRVGDVDCRLAFEGWSMNLGKCYEWNFREYEYV